MSLTNFSDYVQSLTNFTVYPVMFPDGSPSSSMLVNLSAGGGGKRSDLVKLNLQVIVRADHPEKAESEASKILKHFNDKTRFYIGDAYVVHSTLTTPVPMYLNYDGLGNFKFNINISLLMQLKEDE